MNNPLLNHTTLPQFSHIQPQHIVPAIDIVLADNRITLANLIANITTPTWNNFIAPIEILENRLNRTWSPINHLNSVSNTPELREAYNACLPKLSLYATEMGQNIQLYQAYTTVAANNEHLDVAQRKVLDNALRGFRLSGVDLPPTQQARFKDINQQLSQLSSKFSDNVLDATQAWTKLITDAAALDGLPTSALDLLHQNARQRKQDGWLLTLDFPSYLPIVTHAKNRTLRQELYTAYVTRASDQGPHAGRWDNSQLIESTQFRTLQEQVRNIHASDPIIDYCYSLINFSRNCGRFLHGLSPRAGLNLLAASRAWALLANRDYILPEDVQAVAPACLGHRLLAGEDNAPIGHSAVTEYLLNSVPIP